MNCKDTDKMIPLFLTDQLTNRELEQFLNHINQCSECKEELTIQYLVMIGSSLLEEGKSFDLRKELALQIDGAEKKIRRWRFFFHLSYLFEVLTVLVTSIILVMVIV